MAISNDYELVIPLQKDDIDAFDHVCNNFENALHANISKITRNEIASEDLLRELFIKLSEKRITLNPLPCNFLTSIPAHGY